MPKVTIVLPTYNGERFLSQSIKSVIGQSYKDWELIIINDCSSDNTLQIATSYQNKDSRIKVFSNTENLKLPKSLNKGFSLSSGDYLTWTSDDNLYKPNAIEKMVSLLEDNALVSLVSCNYDLIEENGHCINSSLSYLPQRAFWQLAFTCNVGGCFMYRKSIIDQIGEYDANMFLAEDMDYWCKLARVSNVEYCNDNLYSYRLSSTSLSATRKLEVAEKCKLVTFENIYYLLKKAGIDNYSICQQYFKFFSYLEEDRWYQKAKRINPLYVMYLKLKNKVLVNRKNWLDLYVNAVKSQYELLHKENEIVIWGTGAYGKLVFWALNKLNLQDSIKFFCVSEKTQNVPEDLYEKKVVLPSVALKEYPNAVFIIANQFYEQIANSVASGSIGQIRLFNIDRSLKHLESAAANLFVAPSSETMYKFICAHSIVEISELLKSRQQS